MSGLSYDRTNSSDGAESYLAVSDKQNNSTIALTIDIDLSTGAINSVGVDLPIFLSDGNGVLLPFLDTEGVAFNVNSKSIYVSNERTGPGIGIREFDTDSFELLNDIIAGSSGSEFDVFTNITGGHGLESCTARKNGKEIWTTTQQNLTIDPNLTVRLQKLDKNLNTKGQFAYDITADPGAGEGFASVAENNIHNLMALPNGTLISLELVIGTASVGGNLNRLSLYEIDFTDADELEGGTVAGATRVGKRLLYQEIYNGTADPTVVEEFEGIALGPELENGDFSVILIADSGSKPKHALYAFSLTKGANN